MEDKDHWTIRLMEPRDLDAVVQHHQLVYKRKYSSEILKSWYRLRLTRGPFGPGVVSICLNREGNVLGVHGGFPVEIKTGIKIQKVFLICVHSVLLAYRGGGMIEKLFAHFAKNVIETTDIKKIMGFPNRAATKRGTKSFGYRMTYALSEYQVAFSGHSYLLQGPWGRFQRKIVEVLAPLILIFGNEPKALRRPITPYLTVKRIITIPDDYDAFWERACEQYSHMFVKSRKYLQWRFMDIPFLNHELYEIRVKNDLVGYFVLLYEKEGVRIVDFLVLKNIEWAESAFALLLGTIKRKHSMRYLKFLVYNHWLERVIASYRPILSDKCWMGYCELAPEQKGAYDADFESSEWYLSDAEAYIS